MHKTVVIKEKEYQERKHIRFEERTHKQQVEDINRMFLHNDLIKEYRQEIQKKVYGYVNQDKRKKRETHLEYESILEKLVESRLLCSYCKKKVYVLYKNAYDPNQWTLDRINNTIGHTHDNCVISCYSCNKEKRVQTDMHFRQGKQFTFVKLE